MEHLQKTISDDQLVSTTTKESYIKQLYHVNYLVSYPISDLMLEGWSNSIIELVPEITPDDLKEIINRMKLGTIDFDYRKGIQNIFKGYTILLKELLQFNHDQFRMMPNEAQMTINEKYKSENRRILDLLKRLGVKFNDSVGGIL